MRDNTSFVLNARKLTNLKAIDIAPKRGDHRFVITCIHNFDTHIFVGSNDGCLILLRLDFIAEAVCAKLSPSLDGSSLPYVPFAKRMTNVHICDKREQFICDFYSPFGFDGRTPNQPPKIRSTKVDGILSDYGVQSVIDLPVNTEISFPTELNFIRTQWPKAYGFDTVEFLQLITYLMKQNGFVQN